MQYSCSKILFRISKLPDPEEDFEGIGIRNGHSLDIIVTGPMATIRKKGEIVQEQIRVQNVQYREAKPEYKLVIPGALLGERLASDSNRNLQFPIMAVDSITPLAQKVAVAV